MEKGPVLEHVEKNPLKKLHGIEGLGKKANAIYEELKKDCADHACKETKELYSGFDSSKYVSDPNYKINNTTTRKWYNSFVNTINSWKDDLYSRYNHNEITLEEYAGIVSALRHHARIFTRQHMSDEVGLREIQHRDKRDYGNQDGPTFKWLCDKEVAKQRGVHDKTGSEEEFQPDIDKVYKSIIDSSTRTNFLVNLFCGVKLIPEVVKEKGILGSAKYYIESSDLYKDIRASIVPTDEDFEEKRGFFPRA